MAREQNAPRSGSRGVAPHAPARQLAPHRAACVILGPAPGPLPWDGAPTWPGDSREPTGPWRAPSFRVADAGLAGSSGTTNMQEQTPPQSTRQVQGGGRHGAQGWRRPPPAPRRARRHRAGAEGPVPHLLRLQWQVPKPCADAEARGPWGGPGRGGRGRGTAVQPGPSAGGTIASSSRTPTLLAPRRVSGV